MVLDYPSVWPPMERREFAAADLQAESYLEREHNARWAALGVGHATSGITANRKLARNGVLGSWETTGQRQLEGWHSYQRRQIFLTKLASGPRSPRSRYVPVSRNFPFFCVFGVSKNQ